MIRQMGSIFELAIGWYRIWELGHQDVADIVGHVLVRWRPVVGRWPADIRASCVR